MGNGFEIYQEQLHEQRIAVITERLERTDIDAETFKEAYTDAVQSMFRMEDIGWNRFGGGQGDGFGPGNSIEDAKRVAAMLGDWCVSNPLLLNGNNTRNSYLFAEPYEITTKDAEGKITAQQENIFLREDNQAAVFSLEALSAIEGQRFSAGTTFTEFDKPTKSFQQIAFDEIADVVYNPLNKEEIRYVKRVVEYEIINSFGQHIPRRYEEWIPGSKYKPKSGERYLSMIDNIPVNTDKRMVVTRVNRPVGAVFGVPDAFAAAPWALAYSAYLRDGTKVLAALAEWVWKVSPKKRPAAERAAATVRTERGAGGTLFTDMDVKSLPQRDAVDLNTGRPLAAQVAASLGVSIVTLLSDPGQSGAYGTAQTLSDPNRRTMQARREVNTLFLRECLSLIGVKNPDIIWAKMAPGTDKEEGELLTMAWGTGLFEPEEIRPRIAKVAQIDILSDAPPAGVIIPNHGVESTQKMDGTNEQVNGVGDDNLGLGAVSTTATDSNQSGAA